jgi:uncharacterized protein YgbK (DUF1537 family)
VIALIADDLTGASDAAVQFARRGLATRVVFEVGAPDNARSVQALAVDTETRGLPAEYAYARVRRFAVRLRELEPDLVYKKVDSTLRGNLATEIDAVMDAFELRLAIVAPAFPSLGRTTRHGLHQLHGVAVHETEVGRDPKTPVRESHLVLLLQKESRRHVGLIGTETVSQGAEAIRYAADAQGPQGASLLVCDAESDADLRAIADGLASRSDVLWVGSAGLAQHLVDALAVGSTEAPLASTLCADAGPVVLVVGSVSEITRKQLAEVEKHRGVLRVDLDPRRLFGAGEAAEAEIERSRAALERALDGGRDVALVAGSQRVNDQAAAGVAEALGSVAAECVRAHQLGGLIMTGGDTARAVCSRLSISGIDLVAEVEPGVPLGMLVGNTPVRLPAVTKAGGFGSASTLIHALDRLKEAHNQREQPG